MDETVRVGIFLASLNEIKLGMNRMRTAKEVFDDWAVDYHADGMEDDHWPSVREAFKFVKPSTGVYLEVGVGNGYGLARIAENQYRAGRCIGIDVSPNMVAKARSRTAAFDNVTLIEADFLEYDPGLDRPDMIFSMEVFYYFDDIQGGIERAFEILAPGGTLMVLVNHFKERLDSHGWADQLNTPMRLWGAADYRKGFEKAGFTDIVQEYFGIPSDEKVRAFNPGTLGTWGRKRSLEASLSRE